MMRRSPYVRINSALLYMKILYLTILCLVGVATGGQNWPQFRGPQARGVDEKKAAPIEWNVEKGEKIAWRTPIPGLAHSSPIIWENLVIVTTAERPGKADLKVGLYGDIASANDQESHQWRILGLDRATGNVIWNKVAYEGVPKIKRHPKATHCNSTPATDGTRIVAILGSEGLFCFDMHGELKWKKSLGPMDSGYYLSPGAQWGFSSSPVIYTGNVVVQCDVQKDSFLAVFDLSDGQELWRTARKDVPSWSTPTVATVGHQTQILVNGWHHIGAYNFETGKEVWRLDGGGDIPVPTPIVGNGFGYFTSAHGKARPMRAVRLEASGDITPTDVGSTNASIAWVHPRQGNYMQTPILIGDFVYGCFDNGILTCFDARSGKIQYSERLSTGPDGFTSSPVSDGRHLYCASELGKVYVVPADGKFKLAATNDLAETCMATPAISNGTLFYRTREHLIAIRE